MRHILYVFLVCFVIQGIVCPPVNQNPTPKPEEGKEDQDTGLHYDRYLKEVVMTLEEDPEFRKKLEEANVTDIKSGKIAMHLEKVAHHVREKLDEIKRREVNRLRVLAKERMKQMQGIQKIDESVLHHVDVQNPHSFEMKDLERLIQKATKDLDELDKQRREEFKNYELEKEHERREHLKELPEEERKKEEQKYDEMKKKHRDHPKLHHPGSKDQLEEVWEKNDHLDKDAFDPRTFFMKHDLDGNKLLDEEEIEALFQKELDQVYDPNNPEDDMEERYEEMSRMREHVMKELDKDGDKLVSMDEFLQYTRSDEFNKDEGWDTLENEEQYTEEELKEYERMLMEEEERRRQQGAFGSHAQPGLVNQPPHPGNVQQMQMQQGGFHPQGGMPPPGGMHPQGGMPPHGMPQQLHPDQVAAMQQHQVQFHAQQQQAQFHAQQQQAQLHAQQQAQFHAQQQAQLQAQQQVHAQQQVQLNAQQQATGGQPPVGQTQQAGQPPAQAGQGQVPVQGQVPIQGQVPVQRDVPVQRQVPVQGQAPVQQGQPQQTGQVPGQGQQQQGQQQQQQGQAQQQQGHDQKPVA